MMSPNKWNTSFTVVVTSSASIRSDMAVNPEMSANRMVAWRRSDSGLPFSIQDNYTLRVRDAEGQSRWSFADLRARFYVTENHC
jgi:hypothetical protein